MSESSQSKETFQGEVLAGNEMQQKYDLYAENRPELHLDPEMVPEKLRVLVPHAEYWGVGDDLMREDLIEKSSIKDLKLLAQAVEPLYGEIGEWLEGPEAKGPEYSDEYLAFSDMSMVYEVIEIEIADRQK